MKGLYPILHTPFEDHGDVDLDSFRRLVEYVRAARVQGFAFPGFVSEWWRLTDDEILRCAEAIGGGFIGVVTPQARVPALRRLRDFERLGASALMLLPPFFLAADPCGHLDSLLDATDLPCIVQDSAGLTGVQLRPAELAELARRHHNLVAIKADQVPTGPAIAALRSEPALSGLSYIAGYSGVHWREASSAGATALMSGCGHIEADRRMMEDPVEFERLLPELEREMQTLDTAIRVHKQLLFEAGVIRNPDIRV